MSQQYAGSNAAYVGFWTDYDRGGIVTGASLTLRNRDAAILLAFLAVLVGLSANRSWKIWRLTLLAPFRGLQPRTMRKKELQIIFRNSETTGATLLSLLMLPFTSQGPVNGGDRLKTIFAAILALGHMLCFLAAGILTSQVVVGREVTSRITPTCGQWISKYSVLESGLISSPDAYVETELRTNRTIDADNYVRNCYPQGVSRDMLQCGTLMSRYLTFKENHNVECPFAAEICKNGTNSAFEMDTGEISLSDLGINSKYSKQLSFRKRSVCASIFSSPFNTGISNSSNNPSLGPGERILQYTFTTSGLGFNISRVYRFDNYSSGYQLDSAEILSSTFNRSTPLLTHRGKSDLSLVIMNGMGVQFLQTYDDPWFSIHQPLSYISGSEAEKIGPALFGVDYILNILACDEQVQLCSAFSNQCTEWRPLTVIEEFDAMPLVKPNVKKYSKEYNETYSAFQIVLHNVDSSSIANSVGNRGVAALQAARYLLQGVQFRLQEEQWKVELRYWFSVSLARIQMEIFNMIEKPPGLNETKAENFWQTQVPGMLEYCGRVKFRSSDHTSMSALGIGLILALSILLMMGSYVDLIIGRFRWGKPFIHKWDGMQSLALFYELERIKPE
ncbi:hypothetical protein BGZ60DRAFT_509214 [Tricladium varicosporioides]|nr:hypothetical protein BGZ60DRAFT_509214 [Hymenoscyphus varicosporioides]